MRVPRGPRDGSNRPSQKGLPTYTVFSTRQILPGFAQEKLNRTERAAAADVSGIKRHGGWDGRVETTGTAGRKGGRTDMRRQAARQHERHNQVRRASMRP